MERQASTYQAVCSAHREEMKQKEEELLKKQQELAEINTNLMETNRAIATLARNMEMGRLEIEREVAHKVKTKILPIMAGIKNAKIPETVLTEMDLLEAHLKTLIARDLPGFDNSMLLTGTELRIASMIKNGLNSSQIAMQLSGSQDTIKTHRRNIRRKFRLQNQRLNLPAFLRKKMEGSVNERIRNYGG